MDRVTNYTVRISYILCAQNVCNVQIPKPPGENSDAGLTTDEVDSKPSQSSPEAPDPTPPPPIVPPSQPPEREKPSRLPPTELDTTKKPEMNEVESPSSSQSPYNYLPN